jgi:hypothetical protein
MRPSVFDRLRGCRNRLSAPVRAIQSNWKEAKSCLKAREARQRCRNPARSHGYSLLYSARKFDSSKVELEARVLLWP